MDSNWQPVIINKPLEVVRYHTRPMAPKIIVVHIQDGTNWGSWSWWHHVKASSTVLIGRNGHIWKIVPEWFAPWTNGDVQNPAPEMVQVMNKYGWDPNGYALTIELEGYSYSPNPMGWPVGFTEEQKRAMEWQITQWQEVYDIADNMVFRHAQINSVTRANCIPWAMWTVVRSFVDNTPIPPLEPQFATPSHIDGFDGSKDVKINNVTFFGDRRVATISASVANFRMYATRASDITREAQPRGFSFNVLGWVEGQEVNGERRWWITDKHERVWVGATKEKPRLDPIGEPEFIPRGPTIYDGRLYYRIADFNEHWEKEYNTNIIVSRANLREDTSLKSKVVGIVEFGQTITAKYFTIGDTVRNENLWYVLHHREGSLKYGARLWVAACDKRPE